MSFVLIILGGWAAVRYGPVVLAHAIATFVALICLRRCRARAAALLAVGPRRATWDRPGSAERRLLAEGLGASLDVTVLTSLLPTSVLRARRLATRL